MHFEARGVQYVALGATPFKPSIQTPDEPSLVTLVAAENGVELSKAWLETYLDKLDEGDVYQKRPFLAGLILTNFKTGQIPSDFREYLDSLGNRWLDFQFDDGPVQALDPGPYVFQNNALKSVCRLYDDEQRAFLTALKPKLGPSEPTGFLQPKVAGASYDCLSITVPPRTPASITHPEPAPFTANIVQSLVASGAHILGLTKLSSMIAREEPMDAVDYLTAFNPRADGYQSPAGSSSGSAAAVAAYDWVDCGVSTDTSGSGRRPTMVNGVWEFRLSHDSTSLSGMITTYPLFDTPCVFTRSLSTLRRVVETWIPSPTRDPPPPAYKLVYPVDYLPVKNGDQMKLIESFIDDMKTLLPATVLQFSIRDSWKQSHPPGTPDDVDKYLDDVVTRTFYDQFYHSLNAFCKKYSETHNGQTPYVIPFVQRRWAKGAAVSTAEHQDATQRMLVYKQWLLDTLFSDPNTETLIVVPVANAAPNYRDEISPSPEKQSALDELFLQPILGAPDVVIPIGDVPCESRISGKTEFLPVAANVVAAPKRDFQLLQAIEKVMARSGRPTIVSTGPRMFPGN
ncbi:amidase signature domain-containing protein [Ilyonectria sp. MPI-CAGE-AT-0026]|nr:amidase signature domain-containing protein [Ilyonectria sp. MPI-CAGE-AT-0026]